MDASALKSETAWQSAKRPKYRKLASDARFDVVVIGGGITGVTAAYLLKQAGKKVGLLERDRIGGGDSGLTTAHLTYVMDERASQLIADFGEESAALAWQGGAYAIDVIEKHVRELAVDCDFRRVPGFQHAPFLDAEDANSFRKEAAAAAKLGFPATFVESIPKFGRPGVLFPDQAKFHPLKYIAALAAAVHGDGSKVFEQSEITEFESEPIRLQVNGREVTADYVVVATHVPLQGLTGFVNATLFQTKIYPYSSYVIGAEIPKGLLPEACFWDTTDPYYYLRVDSGKAKDTVIFGGEDHKTGQTFENEAQFQRLQEALARILPEATPVRRWSGQVIETNDGLPYIGETQSGQFTATGFAGNGMTFGTLAGVMACDAYLGRENPWRELFSVDRKNVRAGLWDYIAENRDYPYYFLRDRFRPAPTGSLDDLQPGEGRLLTVDGERLACSCDADGKRCAVSAVCTHMGCLVRWNNAEQTWDCPCHGSRFTPDGAVLAGPAETPLKSHAPATTGGAK